MASFRLRLFCEKYLWGRNRYKGIINFDRDDVQGPSRPQNERCEPEAPILRRAASCGNFCLNDEEDAVEAWPPVPRNRAHYVYFPFMANPTLADECYKGVKNPYILIINNVNFETMPAPRGGAVADVENLKEFFKDSGFTSIADSYDLRQQEMLDVLEKTRKIDALMDHDAFICVIMTHGNECGLKGVDDWREKSLEVEEITSLFVGNKCPQLQKKPKLFFIQACRGDFADKGYFVPRGDGDVLVTDADEKEMTVKLPSEADMLVAYSTTKNHVSYRKFTDDVQAMIEQRQMMGSWFISCMVQVFKKHSHREDLMTMLAKVNRAMAELYTGGDPQSGYKQISCQLSMLTKRLYFAKYWQQQEELFL